MKLKLHRAAVILIAAWALSGCRSSGVSPGNAQPGSPSNPTQETAMVKKVIKTDQEWKEILTPEQYRVLRQAGTERAFTGKYNDHYEDGIYACGACGTPLFSSKTKYDHGTGWPSFTAPVDTQNLEYRKDLSHGMARTEVRCAACGSHLGHVFDDGPAPSFKHYCINSLALDFKPAQSRPESPQAESASEAGKSTRKKIAGYDQDLMGSTGSASPSPGKANSALSERTGQAAGVKKNMAIATFAAGCFWGVEDKFRKVRGVTSTRVGYTGGNIKNPTYKLVCSDKTGHAESIEIVFDPAVVSYGELLQHFFRLHDPTQVNRQGPDVGTQYRSVIFYHDEEQKSSAENMIQKLNQSGQFDRPIATQVVPAAEFYPAEDYHQQYYEKMRRGK
jgi:peptide methionine sulfoxide reductase msrA/msrB